MSLGGAVQVGQVWASNDGRDRREMRRQHRIVVGVDGRFAELLSPGASVSTRVLLKWDRETIIGYRLVES